MNIPPMSFTSIRKNTIKPQPVRFGIAGLGHFKLNDNQNSSPNCDGPSSSIVDALVRKDYTRALELIRAGESLSEKDSHRNSIILIALNGPTCANSELLPAILSKNPYLFYRAHFSNINNYLNAPDFALWRLDYFKDRSSYRDFKQLYTHIVKRFGPSYDNHINDSDNFVMEPIRRISGFLGGPGGIDDKTYQELSERARLEALHFDDKDTFHLAAKQIEGSTYDRYQLLSECLNSAKLSEASALRAVKEVLKSGVKDKHDASWPSSFNDLFTDSVNHRKVQAVLKEYAKSTSLWSTLDEGKFQQATIDIMYPQYKPTLELANKPAVTATEIKKRNEAIAQLADLEDQATGGRTNTKAIIETVLTDEAEDPDVRLFVLKKGVDNESVRPSDWDTIVNNIFTNDPNLELRGHAFLALPTSTRLDASALRQIDKMSKNMDLPVEVRSKAKEMIEDAKKAGGYTSISPKEDAQEISTQLVGNAHLERELEQHLTHYLQNRESTNHQGASLVLNLLGRPGIGKTRLVHATARNLFGSENLVEINFDRVRSFKQFEDTLKRGGTLINSKYSFNNKVLFLDELDGLDNMSAGEQKQILGFLKPMFQTSGHEEYLLKGGILTVASNESLDAIKALSTSTGEAMYDRLRQVGHDIKLTEDYRPYVANLVEHFDGKELFLPEFPTLKGVVLGQNARNYFKSQINQKIGTHQRRVSAREIVSEIAKPCQQIVAENEGKIRAGYGFTIDIDSSGRATLAPLKTKLS